MPKWAPLGAWGNLLEQTNLWERTCVERLAWCPVSELWALRGLACVEEGSPQKPQEAVRLRQILQSPGIVRVGSPLSPLSQSPRASST